MKKQQQLYKGKRIINQTNIVQGNTPYYLLAWKIFTKRNNARMSLSQLSASHILWENQQSEGEILSNQCFIKLLNNENVCLQHLLECAVENIKWLQMLSAFAFLQKRNLWVLRN